MSKSLGNGIEPQEIGDRLGVEILRLWLAATDYSGELSISKEILDRVVEVYRRLRNTLRFLLANTADFDVERHLLPPEAWLDIDRYAVLMARRLSEKCISDYARFEFHPIVQALQNFCAEDLGGFYLDILKDRLYTAAADSPARRSAQSALWHILQSLTRLMAPILAFTAEEIWQIAGEGQRESVMLATWHELPPLAEAEALEARWSRLRAIRAEVARALEAVRSNGGIGSSLQAEVILRMSEADHALLASLGEDLKFVFICSQATLEKVGAGETTALQGGRAKNALLAVADGETAIEVRPSPQPKCARCWHWREDVGQHPWAAEHPELCGRCASNLFGDGEARHFA